MNILELSWNDDTNIENCFFDINFQFPKDDRENEDIYLIAPKIRRNQYNNNNNIVCNIEPIFF